MESELERKLQSEITRKREVNYSLIEPREWIPFSIGAIMHLRRWQNYEKKHPDVRTRRLDTLEVVSLVFYLSYHITTTLGALLGAYYLFNRVF